MCRQGPQGTANTPGLVPLTTAVLRVWLAERQGTPPGPLFPTATGTPLSRDAIEHRIALHVRRAGEACPSIRTKKVTAHTLRHTAVMSLLHAGVDTTTIALWLGHAGTKATQVHLHADLTLKEAALARTAPPTVGRARYFPPDDLLAFLERLNYADPLTSPQPPDQQKRRPATANPA